MEQTDNEQPDNRVYPVQGIIFDLDGTLIRSVVDFPKMKHRMIEYIKGLELVKADYTTNQTTNEIIIDLNQGLISLGTPAAEIEQILVRISDILTEVEFENIDRVRLLPGVKEFLQENHGTALKMGILTRASNKYTMECLRRTQIIDYFKVIATRDEFTLLNAKPHQIALDYILDRLGMGPKHILFIGDHHIDHTCAVNGGVRFVGVLEGAYDKKKLAELDCFRLVKDFYELSELVRDINTKP